MGVPVSVAAKVYGKDPCWVRAGLIAGWLPIGRATRHGKQVTDVRDMNSRLGRINYYISPKLLYEDTVFEWNGGSNMKDVFVITCDRDNNESYPEDRLGSTSIVGVFETFDDAQNAFDNILKQCQ